MIRWDEPIEAVHELGRVSKVSYLGPDAEYHLVRFDGVKWYAQANGCVAGSGWQIRNVATPTPPNTPAGYSDEVVGRCVALVERIAADWSYMDDGRSFGAEAREIVALNAPVDADLIEVRRIVAAAVPEAFRAAILSGDQDHTVSITAPLDCLRRGRALAAEGR